ncbi:hypothetical protein ACF1BP_33095 [Streptomyces sp. NPDC014735]
MLGYADNPWRVRQEHQPATNSRPQPRGAQCAAIKRAVPTEVAAIMGCH